MPQSSYRFMLTIHPALAEAIKTEADANYSTFTEMTRQLIVESLQVRSSNKNKKSSHVGASEHKPAHKPTAREKETPAQARARRRKGIWYEREMELLEAGDPEMMADRINWDHRAPEENEDNIDD